MKNTTKRLLIVSNILGPFLMVFTFILGYMFLFLEVFLYAKISFFVSGTLCLFCLVCYYNESKIESPKTECFEDNSKKEITFHFSKYVSFYTHLRVFRGDKLIAKIYRNQSFSTFRGKGYFRVKTLMSDFTKVIVPDDKNFIEIYKLEEKDVKVKYGNELEEIDTSEEERFFSSNIFFLPTYTLQRGIGFVIVTYALGIIL